jgi:hypothetical protein
MAMLNHIDTPYLYTLEDSVLSEGYEFLSLGDQPKIYRPEGLEA